MLFNILSKQSLFLFPSPSTLFAPTTRLCFHLSATSPLLFHHQRRKQLKASALLLLLRLAEQPLSPSTSVVLAWTRRHRLHPSACTSLSTIFHCKERGLRFVLVRIGEVATSIK